MPDRRDPSLDLIVDRYWDAVLAGTANPPGDDIAPEMAATVRRVHALDAATSVHPGFASSLWEELMSAPAMSQPLTAQTGSSLRVHPLAVPEGWRSLRRPQSLSRLAAAVLIIALLAGSAFAALYPLRLRENQGLPLFAPLGTPTVEPIPATVLLDLTLTDIPGFPNEGGMAVTDYPPGGGSVELAGKESPEVFYVATGPLTMRVEEAVDPVRVIPPREAEAVESERLLAVGETATLATGTAVVLPEKAVVALRNEGSIPARMLDLLWATESYSTESGGATWVRATGGRPQQELTFPVSIVLRQTLLEAKQTIPAPVSADVSQAAATLDSARKWDLRYLSEGSISNTSEEPVELYVLTVTSNAAADLPGASALIPAAGTLEFLWGSNGGSEPMVNPYGVGVDPQGNVWVSDGVNDRFQIFAPDGAFLETWGESGSEEGQFDFHATHGNASYDYGDVAFDAEGNIYVADTGNFRVQKFAPDRSFLLAWGGEGTEAGQMMAPGGIAIGTNGTIYVVDENRADVQMFTTDGALLGAFGEPGAEDGQFSAPAGVATDGTGDVWVADFGNNRIQRFSPDGAFLAAWGALGDGDGALRNPNDVAIDAAGRVFVADLNNYRLQALTPDGVFLAEIGGMGSEPGQFFTPNAVAVDAEGVAYVSDNYRVQAFRLLPQGEESPMP